MSILFQQYTYDKFHFQVSVCLYSSTFVGNETCCIDHSLIAFLLERQIVPVLIVSQRNLTIALQSRILPTTQVQVHIIRQSFDQ